MDLFTQIANTLLDRAGHTGGYPTMKVEVWGGVKITFSRGDTEVLAGHGDTLDAALLDAARTLGIQRPKREGEPEPMSREEAEAMLKRLSRHYNTPVSPVNRYCDAIRTWAQCIKTLNQPGYLLDVYRGHDDNKQGSDYADALDRVLRDISKSNLLARLIYSGEKLRTRPCPEHKGHWSGIGDDCVYGCGDTGWLPETTDYPKERWEGTLARIDTVLAAEGGNEHQKAHYRKQRASMVKQMAYLFPTEPGTGVDEPRVLKHSLVFVLSVAPEARNGTYLTQFSARFDFDPFTLPSKTGARKEPTFDVPPVLGEAVKVSADVAAEFMQTATCFGKHWPTTEDRAAEYAVHGRSFSLVSGSAWVTLSAAKTLAKTLQKLVVEAHAPEGLNIRFVGDCPIG